jgi:asparagine synthase (glutamine-hydrolysing)
MGGIAGYCGGIQQPPEALRLMSRKIAHRGAAEVFCEDPSAGVFAVARGQSSDAAFTSEDGKIAVLFSGYLPNAQALRDDLQHQHGVLLHTRGAAEIVTHLYRLHGLNAQNHLRGGFVFAVHDREKGLLLLVRDRMGVEPLYYATAPSGGFVFASEVKALLAYPGLPCQPDLVGIDAYLSLGYSPGPDSMIKGVHTLPAAHRAVWNAGMHVMVEPYWQWETAVVAGDTGHARTDAALVARFGALLDETVQAQMQAGGKNMVLLGGKPEDAALAAAMVRHTAGSLEAVAPGFEAASDAMAASREIAKRLDCKYHQAIVSPADLEKLPEIVWALDAPVADIGGICTHLAARTAAGEGLCLVSGAGVEDILLGKPAHDAFLRAREIPSFLYAAYAAGGPMLPRRWLAGKVDVADVLGLQDKRRFARFLVAMRQGGAMQQYAALAAVFDSGEKERIYAANMSPALETFMDRKDAAAESAVDAVLLAMQKRHALQDGVLSPFDKITHLSGAAARLPYMDAPMVEFLLRLPPYMKYRGGTGRQIVRRHLDSTMPGMSVRLAAGAHEAAPLSRLLNTPPLSDFVGTCLSDSSVRRRGLFSPAGVKALVEKAGKGDYIVDRCVLSLVMLEMWFRIFIDNEKGWVSG